jgi:hypothetical protein
LGNNWEQFRPISRTYFEKGADLGGNLGPGERLRLFGDQQITVGHCYTLEAGTSSYKIIKGYNKAAHKIDEVHN